MPTPRNDSYSALTGAPIYGGMSAPLPSWLNSQPLNTWFQISGTSGAGGADVNSYSGLARVGTKWISAASGGHSGSFDNSVVAIDLSSNAPSWSTLHASSASGAFVPNAAYYTDGRPAARHTYHTIFGISDNRVILPGCRYPQGQGDFNSVDVFNMDAGLWDGVVSDAPGTSGSGWPNINPSGYYPSAQDHNGDLWSVLHSNGNVAKFSVSTKTWSVPSMATKIADNVRYPWALDTLRNQLFGLAWGDGEGFGSGMRAVILDYQAGTQQAINFSAGSASTVSQFAADQPSYAGMDYDPVNDRFLFYSNSVPNRVYVITPNSTSTWDMSILAASGALPDASAYLLVKKLTYFPSLKVFAVLPSASSNIYALRVA